MSRPQSLAVAPLDRRAGLCKVDWYLFHGFIEASEAKAGMRYRALFRRAIEPQRVTTLYAERIDAARRDYTEDRVAAVKELRQVTELISVEEAKAVTNVCGLEEHAGRGGAALLKSGLAILARHWGLRRP